MKADEIQARISAYYTDRLQRFGETPQGVDWNSMDAQQVRFSQVLSVAVDDAQFTINDVGCGYGALINRLDEVPGFRGYTGYDVAPAMVEAARRRYGTRTDVRFTSLLEEVARADYTMASGIFSVKGDVPIEDWARYVRETIDWMATRSRRGFSFNCLTGFSEPDLMRPDLYYVDPYEMMELCRVRFSRNVALLHDYGIYEFTVRVRLN